MKKLVIFFCGLLKSVHLKKDVVLFPIYFKKYYFDEVNLLCFGKEKDVPDNYRGITITALSSKIYEGSASRFFEFVRSLRYNHVILSYLKKDINISHVMVFHGTIEHLILCKKIKNVLPDIKLYIKFDADIDSCKYFISSKNKIIDYIRKVCIPYVDLFTIESKLGVQILRQHPKMHDKVFYVPNGYDDRLLNKIDLGKKKKQIITVGRIGAYQKNTELLLSVISELDMKDWYIKLIGPIEDSFKNEIKNFYKSNPHLRDKVVFTGNISDEKELIKVYEESFVFVLTSRCESSALALIESAINGCYIVSTDVGAIRQISSDKNFCFIVPKSTNKEQNNTEMKILFVKRLQQIIDGDDSFTHLSEQIEYCETNFLMSKIINYPCFKEWIDGQQRKK